jgi:hypothetical protein
MAHGGVVVSVGFEPTTFPFDGGALARLSYDTGFTSKSKLPDARFDFGVPNKAYPTSTREGPAREAG